MLLEAKILRQKVAVIHTKFLIVKTKLKILPR